MSQQTFCNYSALLIFITNSTKRHIHAYVHASYMNKSVVVLSYLAPSIRNVSFVMGVRQEKNIFANSSNVFILRNTFMIFQMFVDIQPQQICNTRSHPVLRWQTCERSAVLYLKKCESKFFTALSNVAKHKKTRINFVRIFAMKIHYLISASYLHKTFPFCVYMTNI